MDESIDIRKAENGYIVSHTSVTGNTTRLVLESKMELTDVLQSITLIISNNNETR